MQGHDDQSTWQRWELYPQGQKEAILEEFRRKRPEDHYNKEQLLIFLKEKLARQEA